MIRKTMLRLLAALLCVAPATAHVTPTVHLVKRGDFVRSALPGASKFYEHRLDVKAIASLAARADSNWHPSAREIKLYVGRDEQGELTGTVVFLRVPSEHGPIGLGVAYDSTERIIRATVTEVGSEPLAWVQPLLEAHALAGLKGAPADTAVNPADLAPQIHGRMSRYYAEVIARGIERAGMVQRAADVSAAGAMP